MLHPALARLGLWGAKTAKGRSLFLFGRAMLFAKRSGAKNVRRKSLDGADEDVDEGDAGARLPTVSTANQGTIKPATTKPAKVAKLSFDEEATEVSLVTRAAKNLRDALVLLCYYASGCRFGVRREEEERCRRHPSGMPRDRSPIA